MHGGYRWLGDVSRLDEPDSSEPEIPDTPTESGTESGTSSSLVISLQPIIDPSAAPESRPGAESPGRASEHPSGTVTAGPSE